MGKTKLIFICGGLLAVVMVAMLVFILRVGDGMERMLLGVCWVVSLLVFLWLIVGVHKLNKEYAFWMNLMGSTIAFNLPQEPIPPMTAKAMPLQLLLARAVWYYIQS